MRFFADNTDYYKGRNMQLDAEIKHEIADNIVIEGRSKTDVVQDVWDEIMERQFSAPMVKELKLTPEQEAELLKPGQVVFVADEPEKIIRKTRDGIQELPPVGSRVEVAGANSDSGREWVYTKCVVMGYTPDGIFAWFQVPGCWPFQEKLQNCKFLHLQPNASKGTGL